MGLQVDWFNSLVLVTSPDVSVTGQVLHDFIEDQMATPRGMTASDILLPEGKIADPGNPGVYSQIILQFNTPWQIQFWAGSGYTQIIGAKLVGGLNNQPMKATGTAGDITVLVSPVDGITSVIETGTSGLTASESQALLDIAADQVLIQADISVINTSLGTMDGSLISLASDIGTMQGDLSGIGISITAIDANVVTIDTNIGTIQTDISNLSIAQQFMADIEGGRWVLDTDANQMILYKADNITEIARFNLYDEAGTPTSDPSRIAERTRV